MGEQLGMGLKQRESEDVDGIHVVKDRVMELSLCEHSNEIFRSAGGNEFPHKMIHFDLSGSIVLQGAS
jgi:hypothetical protein